MIDNQIPEVIFHTTKTDPDSCGIGPVEWEDVTSQALFGGRKVVLFGLPGAFTPACSESHLPGFESQYEAFKALGVDEVLCVSVNDPFVMTAWAKSQGIEKVRLLPDGNGDFTRQIGMLVNRQAQGMGQRSWRYSMYVVDGVIEKVFSEDGKRDNPPGVPVVVSGADTMLEYLQHTG